MLNSPLLPLMAADDDVDLCACVRGRAHLGAYIPYPPSCYTYLLLAYIEPAKNQWPRRFPASSRQLHKIGGKIGARKSEISHPWTA